MNGFTLQLQLHRYCLFYEINVLYQIEYGNMKCWVYFKYENKTASSVFIIPYTEQMATLYELFLMIFLWCF